VISEWQETEAKLWHATRNLPRLRTSVLPVEMTGNELHRSLETLQAKRAVNVPALNRASQSRKLPE
jgi:hypothetical protein